MQRLSAAFPVQGALTWTNSADVHEINRSLPLTLSWSGGPSNASVLIAAASVDIGQRASGLTVCSSTPGATSFQIPAYALDNLPGQTRGVIYLGVSPAAAARTFTAAGLDQGVAFGLTLVGKTVAFN